MGLIDPSGIRDTSLGYGFAPRTISASPNSCMIQAPSLRGSRNHSNDRLGESNGVLRHDRPRSAVPQTMLSPSAVPHTILSPSLPVPQTMLSPSPALPQTMLPPQSEPPQFTPQTMLSPTALRLVTPCPTTSLVRETKVSPTPPPVDCKL